MAMFVREAKSHLCVVRVKKDLLLNKYLYWTVQEMCCHNLVACPSQTEASLVFKLYLNFT